MCGSSYHQAAAFRGKKKKKHGFQKECLRGSYNRENKPMISVGYNSIIHNKASQVNFNCLEVPPFMLSPPLLMYLPENP